MECVLCKDVLNEIRSYCYGYEPIMRRVSRFWRGWVEPAQKTGKRYDSWEHFLARHGELRLICWWREQVPNGEFKIDCVFYGGCEGAHLDIVQQALEWGVNVEEYGWGEEAIQAVAYGGSIKVYRFVSQWCDQYNEKDPENTLYFGCDNTGLCAAAEFGHMDLVQYIVDNELDEEDLDLDFDDPFSHALTAAVIGNQVEIAKYLLECGAGMYTDHEDAMGFAARDNNVEMLQMFIDKGVADINNGLKWAVLFLQPDATRFLVKAGATNVAKVLRKLRDGSLKIYESDCNPSNSGWLHEHIVAINPKTYWQVQEEWERESQKIKLEVEQILLDSL